MREAPHLDNEQLRGFQLRTLAPADLLAVDAHLAKCDQCRLRLTPTARDLGALRAQFAEHLDYDQILACAEGRGSEALEQHLSECPPCYSEVEDLKAFTRELASFQHYNVVAMPAGPRKSRVPVWAPIAAAAILTAGLGYLVLQRQPASQPAVKLAQAPPLEAPLPPDQQAAIQAAVTGQKLERAAVLDRLIAKRGVLLGAPGETRTFELSGPMGTVVLTDRPVFRWQELRGASRYVVALFDDTFGKLTVSPALTVAEWQPEQPLERGRIYNWQVTAQAGGSTLRSPLPPAPEARFQVAGAEHAAQIEAARRDHPGNHLLLAVLLAKAGALDEAAGELDALAATDAATARALRASLGAIRKN